MDIKPFPSCLHYSAEKSTDNVMETPCMLQVTLLLLLSRFSFTLYSLVLIWVSMVYIFLGGDFGAPWIFIYSYILRYRMFSAINYSKKLCFFSRDSHNVYIIQLILTQKSKLSLFFFTYFFLFLLFFFFCFIFYSSDLISYELYVHWCIST